MTKRVREPEQIWADDLLGRRAEAELLMAYIESVAARSLQRSDMRSFTVAVDAGYGQGKSFFLRRLAEHFSLSHPVAYIDAWTDDLSDEPLGALASTLKEAIESAGALSRDTKKSLNDFLTKSGKVAKLAFGGALKRGASAMLTATAVEGIEAALQEGATEDIAKKTTEEAVAGAAGEAFKNIAPAKLMEARVKAFREGRQAIVEVQKSLAAMVDSLSGSHTPPIVIVVDELDRCRPTYAVKFLEEVKHLFDVPGVVFVFGLHGEQLGESVRGAYGANFDGKGYLQRFIGRTYTLKRASHQRLLKSLIEVTGLPQGRFVAPEVGSRSFQNENLALDVLLARYAGNYDLSARDVFRAVDMLQTCVALTEGRGLLAPYLFPLLMSMMCGAKPGDLVAPTHDDHEWEYILHPSSGPRQTYTFKAAATTFHSLYKLSDREFSKLMNESQDEMVQYAYNFAVRQNPTRLRLELPQNYGSLLESVGRFSVAHDE